MDMAAQWMAWTRCVMVTLGVAPKSQISKMTLDCPFDDLLVQVISNVKMIIAITCIAMEVCAIAPSGHVQLISHFFVGDVAPARSTFECKVC